MMDSDEHIFTCMGYNDLKMERTSYKQQDNLQYTLQRISKDWIRELKFSEVLIKMNGDSYLLQVLMIEKQFNNLNVLHTIEQLQCLCMLLDFFQYHSWKQRRRCCDQDRETDCRQVQQKVMKSDNISKKINEYIKPSNERYSQHCFFIWVTRFSLDVPMPEIYWNQKGIDLGGRTVFILLSIRLRTTDMEPEQLAVRVSSCSKQGNQHAGDKQYIHTAIMVGWTFHWSIELIIDVLWQIPHIFN